jgi:iron complex outermembrane receptor protein
VYKFSDTVSLYAAQAESYVSRTGVDIIGRPFVDTVGESSEAGIKVNLLDGRIFGTLTYFDILNDPVMTQAEIRNPTTGQIVFGNVQSAEETNKGVELDIGTVLKVGPGQWLTMATYYNANPRNAVGVRPARVVTYKGSLFSKYEFLQGPIKGFSFGGGIADFGESIGTGIPLQPAYHLYTATIGYRRERWSAVLLIDNLTDERDAITGSEASFSVYTARPRDVRLTVNYRW